MSTYYDYQDVKRKIAHRLMMMDGWKVYGYHADKSDMMTDYYSPAYWCGIAEKNGFLLVVDCSDEKKEPEYYVVRNSAQAKIDAETAEKIAKLERMTQERGATASEEATAKAKIELLKNKQNTKEGVTEEKKLYRPAHKANPPRCNWHIEKDGIIIDKGTGLLKFSNVPDISGYGYGWEREEWQKFNNLSPEEWKKDYTADIMRRWNYKKEEAEKSADNAYNSAIKSYALLEKFNEFIARCNNICGGMVSNGSGEDGYIYEEITKTEYKTELKPVEKAGEIKEGQCFIVKTGFNYGHNRGYVYRIHKSYVRTDGTQAYIAYKLGKGYKKECTGTSGRGNSWSIHDAEKFIAWFEKGALAFCDLEEVKTPYKVKKVVKKPVKAEARTTEEATQESQKQQEQATTAETTTTDENVPKMANTEPEMMTTEETQAEAEKAQETPTEDAQTAKTDTGADMFADLAKAFILGKQAPKKPRKEQKQEQPKEEPTAEEKSQDEPQPEPEPEQKPEPVGYHGESCEVLTAEEIETLTNGGTVYKCEERYLMRHYTAIPYPGAPSAWLVYVISGDTIEPCHDQKYSGFIINGLYYQSTDKIRAKMADDINTELLRKIPDEQTARRLFDESQPDEWQIKTIDSCMSYSRESTAKQLYYSDKKPHIRLYGTKGDKISAGDVIRYLIDPQAITAQIAQDFANSYCLDILLDWIEYNRILTAYNAIMADGKSECHKIKNIIKSVSDQKTIRITLANGNTVKAEARAVSGLQHSGYISSYYIAAADRKHMNSNEYGRPEDITAADIVQITHGARVLYRAS